MAYTLTYTHRYSHVWIQLFELRVRTFGRLNSLLTDNKAAGKDDLLATSHCIIQEYDIASELINYHSETMGNMFTGL